MSFTPSTPLPEVLAELPPPELEVAVEDALRGLLDCSGPVTVSQLANLTALPTAGVEAGLARLEGSGFALRGSFEERGESTPPEGGDALGAAEGGSAVRPVAPPGLIDPV